MKRRSILPAVILLILSLAACGSQTSADPSASPQRLATSTTGGDVDVLIPQAKALAEKTNDLGRDLWEQGQMMNVVLAPNAAAAKPELAKAKTMLDEMTANQKSIASLLDQVARLGASEKLTTYAGQQKEIAELQLLALAVQDDLLEKIELFYEEKGKISQADLETLFTVMEPSGPDDPLAHLEEKGHASIEYFKQSGLPERYYINNGLGEAYDTPQGLPESEGFEMPFPLADGIELWGGDPMDGGGWRMRGSFAAPPAEAMQAERSLLKSEGWSVTLGSSEETRAVMTARKDDYDATFTFKQADPGKAGRLVIRLTGI